MFSKSARQVSRRWDDVGRFYTRLFGVVYVTRGDFYDGSEKGTASVNVCTELRQLASNDKTFLSRVITGDKGWVYGYDPVTKRQSSQWKSPTSPRPKKARQVKSNLKSMISTFFDIKGIVHKEFVPTGQTVNSGFYYEVLRRLREKVRRHRPQLWRE